MRIRALVLTALVVLSSITSVIASDTVTTQDVDISGNYTMTGNYTVSHGTTLTLKPGATVDMQDYWMKVDGNLIADNVTIMSSIQTTGPGSHNAGVWDSLTISSLGAAALDNVTVSNAKSCLIVDGLLQAKHLTVADCLIGIEVDGSATIEHFVANDVDIDGVRVTGDADISDGEMSDMSGGVHSSGDLVLNDVGFMNAGTGVTLTGGTADLADLEFLSGVGNAVSISAGVSGDIDGMSGSSTNAIVSMDSTGFTITDIDMSGERLVNSWSAGNLTISDAVYVSNSGETPIDIRTSGTVMLSDVELNGSFNSNQGSFDAPWIGMALAGSGDYIIDSTTIESTDSALKASGTGTLTITDSTFTSDRIGMSFSGISATTLDGVVVNISSDGEMGVDILQGSHTFTDLEVNMPYNQFATGSTGINAWWCDITGQDVSVNGFANSISVYEAVLNTDDLTLLDSAKQGLYASSSMVMVNDLFETRVSDNGLVLDSSSAVIRTWDASYHDDGGVIDSESEATIWSISTLNNLYADVTGDGVLNYGTSQALILNTGTENRIWEMAVTFEDLTGNPVDADWTVLGFSGTATGGMDTLPVSEAGSKIVATYAGVGAQSTPTGAQGGAHTMQVPIMPQSDWTLTAGTVVVLGPTADGSPHMAGGNVTIPPNAQLFLQDTTLELPEGATLTVDSYGDFEGSNGHLMGDVISHSGDFSDSPTSSISIHGDVLWTSCQSDIELYNLQVLGDVQLDNSCKVKVTSGEVVGQVVVGVGATFEIINTLEITVLDKGEPVQGATVSGFLDGQSVNTGADGKASKSVTALLVDSSGPVATGLMPITMQWGAITDYKAWNTSSSLDYTFTASTIDGGSLTEWLELEKAWSPYHLSSDLIIPQGQTMTVNDGVALRVSEDVTITVEGTFNSGYSTIKSTGNGFWGGLIIGDNAETTASLLGTRMEEGSPLMVMAGEADVVVSNARLSRSSSAEPLVRITNSASGSMQIMSTDLVDSASHCIEAQGSATLILQQVVTQSCASNSLWARGLSVSITDFTASEKVDLGGITGTMSGLSGGDLHVNNLDGFMMSDLTLTSINGSDNREITIDGAIVSGAPAVDLDNTAGSITDLQIDCGGSGVGLTSHHGRASSSLSIADSTISSCTKGIDLHTDGESAAMILTNVDIDSPVAISSDGNNLVINDGVLNGSLDIQSATANLFDVEPTSISGQSGEVIVWSTHIFDIRLNGVSQNADIEVNSLWSTQNFQGSSIQAPIIWKYCLVPDEQLCDTTPASINILASAEGLPLLNQSYEYGFDANEVIQINMIDNQAPSAQIIIPDDGFRVMESLPIEVRAVVSDDLDSIDDLQIVWKATIGQTEMMQLTGEWNNITDLSAGIYVLTLEVTDTQGLTSTDSLSFEVTLLDSDNDWISTCDSDNWFDKEENVYCGPDVYDTNDDNDEVTDSLDPWPTDSCASRDTDGDGQPDNLHCPLGVSTWLTADPDDDGDGIPDVSESAESSEDSSSSPVVIILFVVMFLAAGLFMLRQKKQGVE